MPGAEAFPVVIWHNPRCGTSRGALQRIRDAGIEPRVVDYLREPPDRAQLLQVIAASGIGARGLIRSKEAAFSARGLDLASSDDAALVEAMLAEPILINRPVVISPRGTRLCRPPELVDALLP